MKTIGIVGGTTWHSSVEYYRRINEETASRLGGQNSAKIILWSVNFAEHLMIHNQGGWEAVLNEVVTIGRRLKAANADVLLLGANTLHKIAPDVARDVGLPLLHIADVTGEAILKAGLKKVGLLGTRFTMGEDFYRTRLADRFDLEVVVPHGKDFETIDTLIYEDLSRGNYSQAVRQKCLGVMQNLENTGVEGIILGCTELPKLVGGAYKSLPVFDTLDLHARAAVDAALGTRDL